MTDAHIIEDLIVVGGLDGSGQVSKGFRVELSSFENSSEEIRNQAADLLRGVLRSLPVEMQMQVRLTSDSEFQNELLTYHQETETRCRDSHSKTMREGTFVLFSRACENHGGHSPNGLAKLRRLKLHFYFSCPVSTLIRPSTPGSLNRYEALIASAQGAFQEFNLQLRLLAERLGGRVIEMEELSYFKEFYRFFNPGAPGLTDKELNAMFDAEQSVLENCLMTDPSPTMDPGGFLLNNQYNAIIVLKTLPRVTYSGMMEQLSNLPFSSYEITINIIPLDQEREIEKAESHEAKLMRALQSQPGGRMAAGLQSVRAHIERLTSNDSTPLSFNLIIRTWSPNRENLLSQSATIAAAISRLEGARPLIQGLPTSARNTFEATIPGIVMPKRQPHLLTTEDQIVADLIPGSASASAELQTAEAIFLGAQNNLIGLRTFTMGSGGFWPKQALILAKSSAGKSVMLENILTQTNPYYEFTVIVDTGGSLERFARSVAPGLNPVIVQPNGNFTINYLDTAGQPLSAEHLSQATETISMMIGQIGGEERSHYLPAIIAGLLDEFYRDVYQQWRTDHSKRFLVLAGAVSAFRSWEESQAATENELGWVEFRNWIRQHPTESCELFSENAGIEFLSAARSHEDNDLLFRWTFCALSAEEYPTHSDFHDWLTLEAYGDRQDADKIDRLATLLKPWRRDSGRYGAILDGPGNVSFKESTVYIELGHIPESTPALKEVVSFLSINAIRNEITRRPREQRKRVIIEEMNSFMTIPRGAHILRDLFERSRKYSTWCVAVAQDTQALRSSEVAGSIIGNLRLAILMKQTNPKEIEALGKMFKLPSVAKEKLSRFSDPTIENGAPFLIVDNSHTPPQITEGRNFLFPFDHSSGEMAESDAVDNDNNSR